MPIFTVLGGRGFIGRGVVAALEALGHAVATPARDDAGLFARELGHVIDCAGVTADYRTRPYDTVRAHAGRVADLLERSRFESFLYLSSARLYENAVHGREDAALAVHTGGPADLYNLSKLVGETLVLGHASPGARVVRLANVYGPALAGPNFLASILAAARGGAIALQEDPRTAKDYVALADVAGLLPRIALAGRERLYNVASGHNTSHRALVEALAGLTGCRLEYPEAGPWRQFPVIDIARVRAEFGFSPRLLADDLPGLVARLPRQPEQVS